MNLALLFYTLLSTSPWKSSDESLAGRHSGTAVKPTPVALRFSPTRTSLEDNPSETQRRQYVESGEAEALINCVTEERVPCNDANTPVDRHTCERWRCCWNATNDVPCAKAAFHILKLDSNDESEEPVYYSQCGLQQVTKSVQREAPLSPWMILLQALKKRIVGGEETVDGNWPWMVYIYENPATKESVCGGTLINNEWVLTAAHCVSTLDPSLYHVILGEHNNLIESGKEKYFDVSVIRRHPAFNSITNLNDIALFKLSAPVEFDNVARPACMLSQGAPTDESSSPALIPDNYQCTVLGWGFLDSGIKSNILMKLDLDIMVDQLCQVQTLANAHLYSPQSSVEAGGPKFCAGGIDGKDSCNGDSGGPLLCKHTDGRHYLYGIVSYGPNNCGTAHLPGVYTKVASFRDWVDDEIAECENGCASV